MRWLSGLLFCLLIAFGIAGCGPAISEKDMGTIIYEVPKVEGADKPYEMPELGPVREQDTRPDDVEEE
jgi:hypothetical protein